MFIAALQTASLEHGEANLRASTRYLPSAAADARATMR